MGARSGFRSPKVARTWVHFGYASKGRKKNTKTPRDTPGQDRDHYDQDNTPLTNERTNQTPPTRQANNEDNQPKSGQDRK